MSAYRRVDAFLSPAGWLPKYRDQLWAQCSVTSMRSLHYFTWDHERYINDCLIIWGAHQWCTQKILWIWRSDHWVTQSWWEGLVCNLCVWNVKRPRTRLADHILRQTEDRFVNVAKCGKRLRERPEMEESRRSMFHRELEDLSLKCK